MGEWGKVGGVGNGENFVVAEGRIGADGGEVEIERGAYP